MKINILGILVVLVAASAMVLSCASGPASRDETPGASAVDTSTAASEAAPVMLTPRLPVNYSSLSPDQEGSELTLTGLFSKGADGVSTLVVNPESRSRVTFVLADPEGALAAAAPADGSVITITGILTDASATWRKYLTVVIVL